MRWPWARDSDNDAIVFYQTRSATLTQPSRNLRSLPRDYNFATICINIVAFKKGVPGGNESNQKKYDSKAIHFIISQSLILWGQRFMLTIGEYYCLWFSSTSKLSRARIPNNLSYQLYFILNNLQWFVRYYINNTQMRGKSGLGK